VSQETFLIGVDERQVEAAVFPLGEQGVKRVERRSKTKLDLCGDTRNLPMALGGWDHRDVDLAV
jgi:hypothetical protein